MSNSEFDYLIVGQGLAGSVLSYLLMRQGKKVLVIDSFDANSSSQVAAGLVNPITGRRIVKSWMADTLIPFAETFYSAVENEFGKLFYHKMDVLEVIRTVKELNEWSGRMEEEEMRKYFIKNVPENNYKENISAFLKMIRITSSAWMNIPVFIEFCKMKLNESFALIDESV